MQFNSSPFMRALKFFCFFLLSVCMIYGTARLYYKVTGGFTLGNITSDLVYDSRWSLPEPTEDQKKELHQILEQEFFYLGKGCQSYVFLSKDGNYVLKFFKYQRFRPQAWLEYFNFIPAVNSYLQKKIETKKKKLDGVFQSWKIAYEELPEQTGVAFVHINKTHYLNHPIVIRDKMGFVHHLQADQMEFLLQKTAKMLCPTIKELMKKEKAEEAKHLLDHLVEMLLVEYQHGYADNDHALMQNTGVIDGKPIHIDVGQFIKNDLVKDPDIHLRELFNKTYKFRKWLNLHHPSLAEYLEVKLKKVIGESFALMKPYFHQGDVAKIPHAEQ